eukprot:gnl/Chilomastix_caulleri/793.p1 GENE.gnl/Chilomastix_caulleri/793~~gnl/Chilomastix_caulleri/793.p1  ORF type:complete len:360 (+),score=121.19 gnl/Chilomastix_caulleri/793:66-1145(+)
MAMKSFANSLVLLAGSMLKPAAEKGEQLAFSPWSLVHTLLMFMKTAKGKSVEELITMLHLDKTTIGDENVMKIIKEISEDKSTETAASVFARHVKPTKEYKEHMIKVFGTGVEELISADQVNKWCAKSTHNKITSIIDELDPRTVMILISAIYFKADWDKPFDAALTKPLAFHKLDGTTKEAPMMKKTTTIRYQHLKDFSACRLRYTDSDVSAVIVLPTQIGKEGLIKAIDAFGAKELGELMCGGDSEVDLTLPKFKVSSTMYLNKKLAEMGAKEMFIHCDTTDTIGEDTVVSDVVQKCIVEVDEKGTVAAAVTGMMMRCMAMPMRREKVFMCCDRPFLFYLVDVMSQLVLFSTVILNP